MKLPKIAIMIPFKKMDKYVKECIDHCLQLDYSDFEIFLLPDYPMKEKFPKTRIIPTGPVFPAEKRNIAMLNTDAKIVASIDSDAYPRKDWLKNAAPYFEDKSVAAVGGPNKIPRNATLREIASIKVVYSKLGILIGYYLKKYGKNSYLCKELASSNLLLRKNFIQKIGSYCTELPTGEDSILCFDILHKNKKIVYATDVVVYHHRRELFMPHLRRVFQQSKDKAKIIKKYPLDVDKCVYFLPSLFLLGLFFGPILSALHMVFLILYLAAIVVYFLIILSEIIMQKNYRVALMMIPGIFFSHLSYGAGFLYGLFSFR